MLARERVELRAVCLFALRLSRRGVAHNRLRAARHQNRNRPRARLPRDDVLVWEAVAVLAHLPVDLRRARVGRRVARALELLRNHLAEGEVAPALGRPELAVRAVL